MKSELDSLTADDLMTMAYLNSLPDKNGMRIFDLNLFEIEEDIDAWRRSIGIHPEKKLTTISESLQLQKT